MYFYILSVFFLQQSKLDRKNEKKQKYKNCFLF